jgi:hypothetical protein
MPEVKAIAGEIKTSNFSSDCEVQLRDRFYDTFAKCPIPRQELLRNLGLFVNRQALSRVMFLHHVYQKILDVHGVIMEFGVRWGQDLALFESFRGMYEPYNFNRKLIGFDTFSGFPSVHAKDGTDSIAEPGAYSVTEGYEDYLEEVMDYHEQESPLSHIKKYHLVKGDVMVTIDDYLEKHPETIVALAYFDLDLYEPTRKCLEAIRGHLTKGSVVVFDELNWHNVPGETLAVKEILGLSKYAIKRLPIDVSPSYIVIE